LIIEPAISAFENRPGSLFDRLSLFAKWDAEDEKYKFTRVTFVHHHQTNYGLDDLRYKPTSLSMNFHDFCDSVKISLDYLVAFHEFQREIPEGVLSVRKRLNNELIMTRDGVYFKDWPWGWIYDGRATTPRKAVLAIFELLELEMALPVEEL
jgi:hypothetical protein